MTAASARRAGARSLATAMALAAALAALLAVATAVFGVRWEFLDWTFAVRGLLGVAAPLLALTALVAGLAGAIAPRTRTPAWSGAGAGVAALTGLVVLAGLAAWRMQADGQAFRNAPVHDVATDWRDPLTPTTRLLRRRGEGALPIEAAPALSEGPRGGVLGRLVAEINAAACPAARPLLSPAPPPVAYARLRRAVVAAGWSLVTDDPAAGVLEAVAPAPLAFGGHADVMARVRPRDGGVVVDLRSVSRHAAVDGGGNCLRVVALRAAVARG